MSVEKAETGAEARARIRLATHADAEALAHLRYEFRSELKPPTEDRHAFLRRAMQWMSAALREGAWRCWVAEPVTPITAPVMPNAAPIIPSTASVIPSAASVIPSAREGSALSPIVGALWLHLIPKIPNPNGHPEEHAYLSSFCVRAAVRNAGIGSLLLAEALAFCEAHRIDSIILWPTERSRPLYLRHGFRVATGLLDKPISGHR